jgi:hypothetical protein
MICLDGEMGGIGIQCSLLTMYFRVVDDHFAFVDELYLRLKPDDGKYVMTAKALEINGINLVEHDPIAITYTEGKEVLRKWLYTIFVKAGHKHLDVLGHVIDGDLHQIWDKLMARDKWESYVSYRKIDTAPIAKFLRDRGDIPNTVSGSLSSLAEFFEVKVEGDLHDAKVDTLTTIEVYKKMLKMPITL